jgi:hypothetical protein
MPDKPERIEVFNVNTPGRSSFVQKDKYEEVKRVMQALMPSTSPGLTQDELAELVIEHVSNSVFEDRSKAGWWMKTVQLDLEARQVVVREKTKPLRWHYDPSRKEIIPEETRLHEIKKKEIAELPLAIKNMLLEGNLYEAYQARPFYQRNDYALWILSAKREDTVRKRVAQMIRELRSGTLYMNMEYKK